MNLLIHCCGDLFGSCRRFFGNRRNIFDGAGNFECALQHEVAFGRERSNLLGYVLNAMHNLCENIRCFDDHLILYLNDFLVNGDILDRLLDVVLYAADQTEHLFGGGGRFLGQLAYFLGHDGKTTAMFTSPGCFNRGVERQEVGLLSDFCDGFGDHRNPPGILGECFNRAGNLLGSLYIFAHAFCLRIHRLPSFFNQFQCMYRPFVHFLGRARIIGDLGLYVFDGFGHVGNVHGDFICAKSQFIGRRGDLGHYYLQILVLVFNAAAGIHNLAGNLRSIGKDFFELIDHGIEGTADVPHGAVLVGPVSKVAFCNGVCNIRNVVK
ncbi:hypothetical protein D3C73_729830 [compost metagenome]